MNAKRDGQPVRRIMIDAMRGGQLRSHQDLVVVEEPLEIRLARLAEPGPGRAISITMRTPGHDIELAVGFLHGEGLIRSRNDIAAFFASEPNPDTAAEQVAYHLKKFWEPRMRAEIQRCLEQGGAGLSPLARRGVERL
jgi:formate dehydrogenase assembly factor FdhD